MIGELLAEVRKDHHDTQKQLADKLHVTVSAVRSWEQEKSSPSHETLVNICRLYNISADYLLGLSQVEHPNVFNQEDLGKIREFEEFLLWKKSYKVKENLSLSQKQFSSKQ